MGLALGVHALLAAALTWGVAWKQTPEPVLDAELWSALPQTAAPPLVAPDSEPETEPVAEPPSEPPEPPADTTPAPEPPAAKTPTKADITAQKKRDAEQKAKEKARQEKEAKAAKEKAKKEKAAKERLAKKKQAEEKAKREKAAKEKAAQEAKRREQQRQDQIRRMMGQAGAKGSTTGNASVSSGPSASYAGRVAARIKPNVVLADPVSGNPRAEVEVRADAEGKIISRRLIKSSGDSTWDQAVLRAIDRTGTLPRDTDGKVPSPLIIGLRPQD